MYEVKKSGIDFFNILFCHNFPINYRETPSDGRTHTKFNREASVTSMTVDDLISGRQYQFWVTAVTAVGEGKSSNVVTQTPTDRGEFSKFNCPIQGDPSPRGPGLG